MSTDTALVPVRLTGNTPSRRMIASPTMPTSLSSISSSSILVTSGRSVNLATNLAVSSALSWNFGSSMRWMSVAEYSASSWRRLRSFCSNRPLVPASISLLSSWTAPMTMLVFSGTVSIECTSKPVFMFLSEAASGPLLVKKSGWPVSMTLPTLPVPFGSFISSSFSAVCLNCSSLALLPPHNVGE